MHSSLHVAVKAITAAMPATQWVVVWLWCPRDVAAERIAERGTGDMTARLRAWDKTEPLPDADISINTAEILAAEAIHRRVRDLTAGGWGTPGMPPLRMDRRGDRLDRGAA